MASTPTPARARRPLPQPADHAMASASARRSTARARRPLPPHSDRAMASTSARRRSARGPAAQTFLPDEIWEEIFLLLDAADDLARASASCSTFRRIVSERRFLRRFRSLRSPAVLGFISISRDRLHFVPVEPPHRSAPEAPALEQTADFTFSFLPILNPRASCFLHASDGRVLLSQRMLFTDIRFEDFVVCDPLHRRYVKIPRIPDDVWASAAGNGGTRALLPVLAPALENDEEESFRVICTVLSKDKDKVMAFVFSSCNQTWRRIISTICLPNGFRAHGFIETRPYYAHGCVYWMFGHMGYSLMLDTSEIEFSIIDLPPHNFGLNMRAIVEAADDRLGFLTNVDGTIDLYSKNWQSNGVGAQEWHHGKLIPLPKDSGIIYHWRIVSTAGRYVVLQASRENCQYFVLDIKTLLLDKICTVENNTVIQYGFPYARFPPPLALPSI